MNLDCNKHEHHMQDLEHGGTMFNYSLDLIVHIIFLSYRTEQNVVIDDDELKSMHIMIT
jgi:hypothetical protein